MEARLPDDPQGERVFQVWWQDCRCVTPNFNSINMYKKRFRVWGLTKNLKGDEALATLHVKEKRDAIGKGSEFLIRGVKVQSLGG